MTFTETIWARYTDELKVAIEHPFLAAAGKHEISREKLSEWLTQDRSYALKGYPKFIAQLILALPLSSPAQQTSAQSLLALFSYCLSNISREVGFFDSLGPKYNLDLSFSPPQGKDGKLQGKSLKPATKAYVDTLIATGAEASRNGGGVEEGMVLLWAMEKVSPLQPVFSFALSEPSPEATQAWSYASRQTVSPGKTDEQTSAALVELIDNWTNQEFVDFNDNIEKELDKLDIQEGTEKWERCEEMFKYTLWLEQRFWPDM
ncbi:hypothetical protein JCM11641_002158 [Rhodosporidiobolus odoratus]